MPSTKKRGFAAMSPEVAQAIRSKGGQNSPSNFKNLPKEVVSNYGRKGGSISRRKR